VDKVLKGANPARSTGLSNQQGPGAHQLEDGEVAGAHYAARSAICTKRA